MFCTFEASGAMATRVSESVHRYLWCASCYLERRLETGWSWAAGCCGSYPSNKAAFSLVASTNCGFGVDSAYSNRSEQEAPTSPTDSTTDHGSSRADSDVMLDSAG
jgi:hypothetical protein